MILMMMILIILMIITIVCSCHVTYAFQNESTHYSCLNIKELLAWSRCEIWSLSDYNWTRTQNDLVRKGIFNHLAKWLSVRLRTKWFWVRVQLQIIMMMLIMMPGNTKWNKRPQNYGVIRIKKLTWDTAVFLVWHLNNVLTLFILKVNANLLIPRRFFNINAWSFQGKIKYFNVFTIWLLWLLTC